MPRAGTAVAGADGRMRRAALFGDGGVALQPQSEEGDDDDEEDDEDGDEEDGEGVQEDREGAGRKRRRLNDGRAEASEGTEEEEDEEEEDEGGGLGVRPCTEGRVHAPAAARSCPPSAHRQGNTFLCVQIDSVLSTVPLYRCKAQMAARTFSFCHKS